MTSGSDSYVVLVTGGAGFLGQHVIGLLQTRADYVTEIRVLDVVPYVNKLDYEARKPVRQFVGSINDIDIVTKACEGVHCVMHLASFVDVTLIPDMDFSYTINVLGTQTVIDACRATGVRRLIYCSTMDVAIGKEDIYNGTESSKTAYHDNFFKVYGQTKAMAEEKVLNANDCNLQTVSLRPVVMYGEWETRHLVTTMTIAKKYGSYPRFNCGKSQMALAYAGNVAWAFICTDKRLKEDESTAKDIAGHFFFIGDESPSKSLNEFFHPMFVESGYKRFPIEIPQWIVVYPLFILYLIFSLISLVYRVNLSHGAESVAFLTRTYLFSHEKATRVIGYKPVFTFEEAKVRVVKFMKSFKEVP